MDPNAQDQGQQALQEAIQRRTGAPQQAAPPQAPQGPQPPQGDQEQNGEAMIIVKALISRLQALSKIDTSMVTPEESNAPQI